MARFSRFVGRVRIGADFFERIGAAGESAAPPTGVVDRMSDLANPGIDVARIHPHVVTFFEDTASLDLLVRSAWRFPFSITWAIFRPIMRWIGQFVLPRHEGRIETRVHALDRARDGRSDARAVIRTYAKTSDVMQAVAYATWERGGTRYMSAAFPLPGGHMAGFLRLDPNGEDEEKRIGIALTSKGGDAGVWMVVGSVAVPSPFGERLELWGAGTSCAPPEIDPGVFDGATIVGRHTQRLFGVRFVTHHYWFRPRGREPRSRT